MSSSSSTKTVLVVSGQPPTTAATHPIHQHLAHSHRRPTPCSLQPPPSPGPSPYGHRLVLCSRPPKIAAGEHDSRPRDPKQLASMGARAQPLYRRRRRRAETPPCLTAMAAASFGQIFCTGEHKCVLRRAITIELGPYKHPIPPEENQKDFVSLQRLSTLVEKGAMV
jgi:hypothetical protein